MVSYIILKYKEKVELIFGHSTTLKEFLCLMTMGVLYIPCSHYSMGMSFTIDWVPFTTDFKDNVEIVHFFIQRVKV